MLHQPWHLDHRHQRAADQHPIRHALDPEPARQQHDRDHHDQVSRGQTPSPVRTPGRANRARPRRSCPERQEEHARQDDPDHVLSHCHGLRRTALIAGAERCHHADKLRREQPAKRQWRSDEHDRDRRDRARDATQVLAIARSGELDQHRHQRRLEHAADNEIEEQGLDVVGDLECGNLVAGAEIAGGELLADQPENAAGEPAGRDQQRGPGDPGATWRMHRAASGTGTRRSAPSARRTSRPASATCATDSRHTGRTY